MTGNNLATRPANVLRNYTQQVRDHASAMRRLQDQYFAALKRAEAQYFDGVKKITDVLTNQAPDDIGEQPAANEAPAVNETPVSN